MLVGHSFQFLTFLERGHVICLQMFKQANLDCLPHEILTCIFIWSQNNELPLVSRIMYGQLQRTCSIGTKVDWLLERFEDNLTLAATQGGKFRFFNINILKRLDQLNGTAIRLDNKRIPSNLFSKLELSDETFELITEYLERGGSSKLPDGYPIIKSCQLGHIRLVKMLIKHGADPSARKCLALRTAAVRENRMIVDYLLDEVKMKPDTLTLKECVKRGKLDIANVLMAHGAVPDMETLNSM